MAHFISLGPNCHPAGNLRNIELRKLSTPFDWLLTNENKGLTYVVDNINNNFENFLSDLEYNDRDKVVSRNYPNTEFFHFDLLKNKSLIETMKRRAKRFMDLISNPDNYIVFLYYYSLNNYLNKFQPFLESIKEFESCELIKAKYKLIIYVSYDNDYDFKPYPEVDEVKNTVFIKYVRDISASKYYGKTSDFKNLLKNISDIIGIESPIKEEIKKDSPKKEETKKDSPKKEDTNEFIIKPTGGLCNKIRVLFSYLVRTRLNNKKLICVWDKDNECNGLFLDYFKPINDVTFVKTTKNPIDYTGCYANKSFERKLYVNSLKELKLNERMEKEVAKMIARNLKDTYSAVHIRRTDHVKLAKDKQNFTSDKEFEEFIEKNNKKNLVYLATDNIESQKYFIKFKNTIYNKPIRESKEKRQTSLEDAIIDLYVCVKARNFKGTNSSSFTELIDILRGFK